MMAGLVDHKRTGEAVKKSDKYINTKSGQYRMQKNNCWMGDTCGVE